VQVIPAPTILSVAEAQDRLLALVPELTPRRVSLAAASGLVLAAEVLAARDLPGFANSAMDGFAVRAADTRGATPAAPVALRLLGEVAAGGTPGVAIEPATAVRIMTGAPLPPGADAVVEVERSSVDGVIVHAEIEVEAGRSIRWAGEDVRRGEAALARGKVLGPAQLALLAALGVTEPLCVPRPLVAVIPTGDELVDPAIEPGPGQVSDVVSTGIPAAVAEAGGDPHLVRRAGDTEADVRRALADAAGADLVISVGGVSMGDYDFVRRVIEADGRLDFWKVAMRPGRPLAVGRVGGSTVVGLPGNPVSALVGFEIFVLPVIVAMTGRPGWCRRRETCVLTAPIEAPVGLRTFARAEARRDQGGRLLATPLEGQGSHQLRWMAAANVLLDIPAEVIRLEVGQQVEAIRLDHRPGPA
jgi:molybdopterin molybdotransferase